MSPPTNQTSSGPEWVVIAVTTLVGAVVRLVGFGRLGLDHFDEGIYASAGFWSLGPGGLASLDPGVIPYAPPGYPILVGLADSLLGPSDRAAIAISLLAGIATIPVVGWLGRRCFGPGAGAAAAAFVALSGAQITFSRMALTDATFLLTWLAAMIAGGAFLEKPGPWTAAALGLLVGLAQLVKYNGWLAGAVVALTAGLGPIVAIGERSRAHVARTFGWGVLASIVAAVVYAPWFGFVEAHGGYAALLKHQRGYVAGPGAWPSNWLQQLRQLVALDPFPSAGLILAVLVLIGWLAIARRPLRSPILGILGLWVIASIVFRAPTLWWLGLALLPFLVMARAPAVRLVGVWWLTLSILTPMYHPYARLWLPLEASGWVMIGAVLATVVRRAEAGERGQGRAMAVAVGLAWVAGWTLPGQLGPRPRPLPGSLSEPRDSLRAATARVVAGIPPAVRSVGLLGRPAMLFYASPLLVARGIEGGRLPDAEALLASGAAGWAIVDTALLREEGGPDALLDRLRRRWEVVAEVPTTLSKATLLDVDPASAVGDLSARSSPLLLLRSRP